MVKKYERKQERRGCRARILRMLKKKNTTVEELMTLYEEKNIFLFKGHEKELYITLLEGNDIDMLVANVQNCSSLHRRIIKGTVDREGCTLREFGGKKLHKDVRAELDKMIQNEMEQNKKQEEQNVKQEQKMISAPIKPLVIACRLTDHLTHLVDAELNVHREPLSLSLSNRALCGKIIVRKSILKLCNKATCKICIREEIKRSKVK